MCVMQQVEGEEVRHYRRMDSPFPSSPPQSVGIPKNWGSVREGKTKEVVWRPPVGKEGFLG